MTNPDVETEARSTQSFSSVVKDYRVTDVDNALNEVPLDEERKMLRKFDGLLLPPLALMFVVRWFSHCLWLMFSGIWWTPWIKVTSGTQKQTVGTRFVFFLNYPCLYTVDPRTPDSRFRTSVLWEIRLVFLSYFYLIILILLTWLIVLFACHDILRAFLQKFCSICRFM
jgi:hypothetical protein